MPPSPALRFGQYIYLPEYRGSRPPFRGREEGATTGRHKPLHRKKSTTSLLSGDKERVHVTRAPKRLASA